jgi:Fe-Mn family superoxide dismutase
MKIQFPELPYALNSLDQWIDTQTMDLHYNKHQRKYFEKLMEAAEHSTIELPETFEQLFSKISTYEIAIKNNGGGLYNHTLFWNSMTPNYRDCIGPLREAIEKKWKTFEAFEKSFTEAAVNLFASGWVWLILDENKELQIAKTANHDNPLMDFNPVKGRPLLVLDVWEHAYYLRYKNERPKFIDAWWDVVNWKYAEDRFAAIDAKN